jgi:hypothetical protein
MLRVFAAIAFLSMSMMPFSQAGNSKTKEDNAEDLLKTGLKKAKADNKAVFLSFGVTMEMWSEHLDKYNGRPAVKKILDDHLVFVKVIMGDTPGAEELYLKYGPKENATFPFWVILSPEQKVLVDALDENQTNVGFPYEENELKHYKKVIKKAIPKLTDKEVDTLIDELKAEAPKKQ